jgi:hypothetical protein
MAKAKNPFTYGGRVTGEAFCNRKRELEELLSDIKARQHLIPFSQRRFGKTYLVWRLLAEARKMGSMRSSMSFSKPGTGLIFPKPDPSPYQSVSSVH